MFTGKIRRRVALLHPHGSGFDRQLAKHPDFDSSDAFQHSEVTFGFGIGVLPLDSWIASIEAS